MMRTAYSGMGLLFLATALSAVGCCDQEKKQLAYVKQQNDELAAKDKDLRDQLVGARTRESDLLSQLDSKTAQVSALQSENNRLKQQPATGVGVSPGPGTAETPVYRAVVAADILFAAGRADMTDAGKKHLDGIAQELNNKYAGMAIRVLGYTDGDPIRRTRKLWTDNLDLSANRAMAVTRHLIGKGIDESLIETIAMGATHFIAPNNTAAGKAKNRRVEIVVVKKQ